MTIQPDQSIVSINTAKEYLSSFGVQPISRVKYEKLLGEANEEGRLMQQAEAAQFTKDEFASETFWQQYPKELVEEFYIAYRRGYIAAKKASHV